ncbi:MAG TPA: 4-alpha-glucanotransferase [Candidatus Binatia bacterium]|nr:4-alpha-glucanotransferase [Candidatus Binatia bacterium]
MVSSAGSAVRREAGVLLPLFSLRSGRDWGIGEIGDLGAFAGWLAGAGHGLLQLLPVLEMSPGERSPYAAASAFALDPIYLSLDAVEDFVAAEGAGRVADDLAAVRATAGIDYDAVRRLKRRALEIAFAHFAATESAGGSARAARFDEFRAAERAWLDDYSLFRACQEEAGGARWREWLPGLRDRVPAALADAAARLARSRRFHEYVQWIAAEQWAAARRELAAAGVRLKGDLPFVLSPDAVDVWARPREFDLGVQIGAPPDAFNADGQAWGLPAQRWDVMEASGFAWLRERAARAAALFDAFRVDHVVGFYRQYVIPGDGPAGFVPADEDEQRRLGERLLRTMQSAAPGATLIGEDLGVVPPFVRRSLAALAVPGYRVLRWEAEDGAFRDPTHYPDCSVATSGTHDTSPLATWWEDELDANARAALARVPVFATLGDAGPSFTPRVHDALLDGLYAAGSALVVVPFPDAYGGRERINVPATIGAGNWGYRLPWTVAELGASAGAALAASLRERAVRGGRA